MRKMLQIVLALVCCAATINLGFGRVLAAEFDVKSFGATGNGSADDTMAIMKAIAAAKANGGRLRFPFGTYKISSEIAIEGNNIHVHFDDARITTTSNEAMLRFGA